MKISCPHCGVHGAVDNSLIERKLRCPKCSKVFLVTEELLPEVDDTAIVHQEILYDDEPHNPETVEQESVDAEESVAPGDENLEQCSVCKQSFVPFFLVEIDSKNYCALCRPDSEEELESSAEEEVEEIPEDELLEIEEEDFADEEIEEILKDEEEDDFEEAPVALEPCSGCGESLHPEFLETVGSEKYCALCVPEETEAEDEESIAGEDSEKTAIVQDDEIIQDNEQDESEEDFSAQDTMGEDEDVDDEMEDSREPCSVCGEEFHRALMQEVDSKLYCSACQLEETEDLPDDEMDSATDGDVAEVGEDGDDSRAAFTIGDLMKEAWQKTKGAKASIWAAMIVMYLILFGIVLGGQAAFGEFYKGTDPAVPLAVNGVLQLVSSWFSMLMTGGVMLIGVRRALEQRVSWKMVFAGFSKVFSITMAIIIQTLLVIIGFVLFVLPGIYLCVGYALTLPLILDKGMGPWEALEASRKAIHKRWWTVFGLYLVMMLFYMVSAIPLGLGLIWTVPMFFVLTGVLYVRLFCADASVTEEIEEIEEIEEECEEEIEEIEDALEEKYGRDL